MQRELTLKLAPERARELTEHATRAHRSGLRGPGRPALLAGPAAALARSARAQAATGELAADGTSDNDNHKGEPK
jgi:hypothetical protein